MNTARVSVCLAILLCGTFVSPLFAQGPPGAGGFGPSPYGGPPVGQSSASDASPDTYDIFDNRRFQFRSDIGDGVGYQKGFQTFGAFQPIQMIQDEFILFLNPRGVVTYEGQGAFNGGVGTRWYNRDNDRIWGVSGWYDFDNTLNNAYNQWGLSFESLGQYLDFRANAYILTNSDSNFVGSFTSGATRFIGNNIGIDIISQYENPLNGGDFEVGGALPGIGDIGIRTYAGGYYYQGEGTGGGVYGVRARGEALITQDFWGGVMVTHDRLFGTNVTGAFTWYWGSGQAARWFQRIPVPDRMWQQVERQYRIAVWDDQVTDNVLALRNGGTGGSGGPVGTPIFVVHVNNAAAAGGDGTYEHPLNFLPTTTASEADIVFVNRGNGTSSNMNQGITLNNYQRLLGQGVQHLFTSTQGTFVLPGYSPGVLPSITNINAGGDAVTLASFNEVSGFNITGAGRHAIYGNGIDSFNINNINAFNNGDVLTNTGAGIQITNVTGTGLLADSTLTDNAAEGFRAESTGTTLDLAIRNVDATGNLSGFVMTGDAATYTVDMRNSTASSNRHDGIVVSMVNGSNYTGVFDNITANSNNNPQVDLLFGNGFTLNADASTVGLNIQHSTFNSNNLNGISVVGVNGSAITLELYNNNTTISNNLLNGLFFDLTDSSGQVVMLNNTFANNGEIGAFLRATNGSLDVVAGGLGTEDINHNGQLDPGEDVNGNGVLDFEGNTFDGNHGAGLAYTLRDFATGSIDVLGSVFIRQQALTGNTTYIGQGLDIRLTGSTVLSNATATLTSGTVDRSIFGNLTDTTLGNAGGGILVYADQRTTLSNVTVGNADGVSGNGNLVASNTGNGIEFQRRNEANINNVLIQDNRMSNNTNSGLRILAANTGNDINDYAVRNNIITNNGNSTSTAGVLLRVEADAQLQVDMSDNNISGNIGDGIQITEQANSASDNRSVTGIWNHNTITNNTQNGINIAGETNRFDILDAFLIGSTSGLANGNTITGNGGIGIVDTAPGSATIRFNNISNNNGGGVYLIGNTYKDYHVDDNIIVGNNGDGLRIQSQGPFSVTVDANRNFIRDNTARGVNILNEANNASGSSGFADITLNENFIIGNFQEGVYVVNTAAFGQGMNQGDALLANGNIFASPVMFFTMTNNVVEGNGRTSTNSANGLVMLIGTSDGGYDFADNGGFFAGGTRGGVGATVQNNAFSGNFGDDVFFQSFVSTVDPPTPAGTWSATDFNFTAPYRGDPLARLDLLYSGNTTDFGAADVTNTGAFYNNADGVFKSRLNTATDPGPFQDADRHRNAQRLAGRFGLGPATPGGVSNLYLYPGIGTSTFRLMTGSDTGVTSPFFGDIDTNPYTNPFTDSAGVFYPGDPGRIQAMPYGWSAQ